MSPGTEDAQRPHRRRNALTGEWVLVSPHRMQRPWQGRTERLEPDARPPYDPACYLCPRNERAGGARNPDYDEPFVFTNDFAALIPIAGAPHQASGVRQQASEESDRRVAGTDPGATGNDPHTVSEARRRTPDAAGPGLLESRDESGTCRVVCFSPRHDLTLAEMDVRDIRRVVDVWAREYAELGARDDIGWVQIFENKGELMGCSNPHPHGQIWAQSSLPGEPAKEDARQREHFEVHGRTLLADYLALELERGERIVVENDAFVALVPFWAVWPFETLVIARAHRTSLLDMNDAERDALADMLKRLTTRYDNLFETSFPYSMGVHQAPTRASGVRRQASEETDSRVVTKGPRAGSEARRLTPDAAWWHFHMHFYPPLLRSATVKKFMVGYEMLGEPQRDLTPEAVAQRLRETDDTHYRQRAGS